MRHFVPIRWQLLLGIVIQFSLLSCPSFSQTTYGSVVGTIRDSAGGVVPEVQVTVTNEASGEKYSKPADAQGAYAFTTLIPGIYNLHAELPGFRPIDLHGITLQVAQTARYDLMLEVGQVNEAISITAHAPVLSQDTSEIGQVINQRQIVDLPLNGRNFLQLASLTNGVRLQGNTESGGPQFTSDGNRVQQNSFLIDGIESRIQREGGYGVNLSIDAIQEFKILQNSYPAEYGRASAIIDTVIRSGTNSIHGTLFEFLRNNAVDARNFFDLTSRPPLRQNQFGGSAGGPIKKDKLFYFLNYEGERARVSSTRYTNVPTAAMLNGDLSGLKTAIDPSTGSAFPNNQIPADRLSQFAKASAPYYPAPNSNALANLNYVAVLSNQTNMDQGTARIDYALRESDRISGHYTAFHFGTLNPGVLPYNGTSGGADAKNISAEYIHTFGPNLINTFRFGYANTDYFGAADRILTQNVTGVFGLHNLSPVPEAYAPPNVGITGFGTFGAPAFQPTHSTDINKQFVEQFAYIRGRHSFKAGADLRLYAFNDLGYATQNGQYTFNGQYTGNPMADFLLGIPNYVYGDQVGPGASFGYQTTNNEYSFYTQDDIRVSRSLTVNAGLRYEYVQWPKEKNNEFASWDFQKGTLVFACKDIPCRVAPSYKNGWSPRLGFAYSPSWLKKTVIRGAAAIVYSNFRQWEVSLFHFTPPFVYEYFINNDLPKPSYTAATLWPAVPQSLSQVDFTQAGVNYQNPDKVLPRTYQWNFGVQHELLPDLLLEVRYVGNRSVHLPTRYDSNAAAQDSDLAHLTPIQSRRPYQNVGFVSGNASDSWSNYNALEVRAERRFSGGFSVLGIYTWSKSLGIRNLDNFTVFDFNHIRLNYGPVNDITHRAVVSFIYQLPFGKGAHFANGAPAVVNAVISGWQINGITSFNSGPSVQLTSSVTNGRGNRAGNYPNCIGNPHVSNPTRFLWFNTMAFQSPLPGTYGNCGEGVIRAPGLENFDLSLFRNIRLLERATLQFRAEAFNAFNHVNFNAPVANVNDPNFGRITAAASGRIMQFGLKLVF